MYLLRSPVQGSVHKPMLASGRGTPLEMRLHLGVGQNETTPPPKKKRKRLSWSWVPFTSATHFGVTHHFSPTATCVNMWHHDLPKPGEGVCLWVGTVAFIRPGFDSPPGAQKIPVTCGCGCGWATPSGFWGILCPKQGST